MKRKEGIENEELPEENNVDEKRLKIIIIIENRGSHVGWSADLCLRMESMKHSITGRGGKRNLLFLAGTQTMKMRKLGGERGGNGYVGDMSMLYLGFVQLRVCCQGSSAVFFSL